ncbi:hypothetical protein OESDEN_22875, partial [Oesophagostomum dentatum]
MPVPRPFLSLLLLVYLTGFAHSQNCNNAPTAALQVICNQIAAWSLSSRAISPVSPHVGSSAWSCRPR